MKKSIFLFAVICACSANLELILPEEARSRFNYNGTPGAIAYSVSTFGSIPYTEKEYITLLLPAAGNELGCRPLERPSHLNKSDKIVWLVKRGECTYSKKAFIAQQSGAYAVMVYHNSAGVNVNNVIPCSDSICGLSRQQLEDPDRAHLTRGRHAAEELAR